MGFIDGEGTFSVSLAFSSFFLRMPLLFSSKKARAKQEKARKNNTIKMNYQIQLLRSLRYYTTY
ncbi:hypothetical protein EON69_00750 [bacterium]|nr:MAG: hypothetical protein EON69_00750 [bacterium]